MNFLARLLEHDGSDLRVAKWIGIAIACLSLCSGCDHTRVVRQSLEIGVVDRNQDRLECKEIAVRENAMKTSVDVERERFYPGRFEKLYPWSASTRISESGNAVIVVESEVLVNATWASPPIELHPFTGKSLDVKIIGCSKDVPVFQIRAIPGESHSHDGLVVEIVSVSNAEFL